MKPRLLNAIGVGICLIGLLAWPQSGWSQGSTVGQRLKDRLAQRQPANAESANGIDVQLALIKPGEYRFNFQHDGLNRMYRVHLPASYKPATPVPLLFALHGGGGNMELQADDAKYGH